MDATTFRSSLSAAAPPQGLAPLLTSLWYDGAGDWGQAHTITQGQAGAEAAAVHAYLHRKEGDLANADYWYRQAGRSRPTCDLRSEWLNLVESLLAHPAGASVPLP